MGPVGPGRVEGRWSVPSLLSDTETVEPRKRLRLAILTLGKEEGGEAPG